MPTTATHTSSMLFRKALSANSTSTSFATTIADLSSAPASAASESAGGYIDLSSGRLKDFSPNTVLVKFFGVGSDNDTGACRIFGVRRMVSANGATESWTHTLLAEYAFTLSAAVGVAGGVVSASERYADTITRTTGIDNVSDQLLSPTGDEAGHVLVDCKGHSLLFFEPIRTGGSPATSVNALFAGV